MRRSPGISVDEPAELDIARMRRRHLKGVMAIERQVYPRPWSPNLFLSEMGELRTRAYLVARMGKDIVGYGGVMCYGDEAHITTFAVLPEFRRRKIGERMLVRLFDMATDLKAEWLTLEVRASNFPAQRLYEKYGFHAAGIRRRYYSDNNEDAIIMWTERLRDRSVRDRLAKLRSELEDT